MKYILGVLGLFLVTIIAIVLVTRQRGANVPTQQGGSSSQAAQYDTKNTAAAYTTQGKLVGENERRAIRIKVSQSERRLEVLTGYNEGVERSHVFPNTETAYETFLAAVGGAGFTRENKQAPKRDERAVCPLGKHYVYELNEFSQQISRLWGTTCSPKLGGTFGGNPSTIRKLFQAQITEYNKLVRDVEL